MTLKDIVIVTGVLLLTLLGMLAANVLKHGKWFAFVLCVAFCASGCKPEPAPAPRWEYKTVDIYDDSLKSMKPEDKNRFSEMDIQKELKTYSMGDEHSSDWEMCGCFLEPRKDPCVVLVFKRKY